MAFVSFAIQQCFFCGYVCVCVCGGGGGGGGAGEGMSVYIESMITCNKEKNQQQILYM